MKPKPINAGGLIALILCCALLLATTACGPLDVVQGVIAALEAGAQALPTSTLSTADKALAAAYYASVNAGLACVTTELATGDTGVVRDAAVGACIATALAAFPALPGNVQLVAVTVNVALAALKAWYSTGSTAKVSSAKLRKLEARRAAVIIKR